MKKQEQISNINTYLIVALVIVVAVGLYFTLSVPSIVKKEAPQPIPAREIQLSVLGTDCDGCFNITIAVDFLKQQKDVNVTDIKQLTMEEAKTMTEKYNISRLPALLITGNISNLTIPNFNPVEDALVFDKTPPPYYDVAEKHTKGKVGLVTLADPSCTECFDISAIVGQLKQAGVKITSEQTLDSKSDEGKGVIEKYHIEKLPTLIFTKDALEYDIIKQVWKQVGTEESDGKLVLRFVNPPYVNTSTGKIEGLVEITYLTDETCADCFNSSVYNEVFSQSFSMHFAKEEKLDVSSTKGKFLIKKYNITAVPAVVLSKEAGAYGNLAQAWKQVGTVEKDGIFVFRNVALLENYFKQSSQPFAYKDLVEGKVVTGKNETAAPSNETEEADIVPPSEE